MMWLLISTGFTGALSLVFMLRRAHRFFIPPPHTEVLFSPKGGCEEAVVRELKRARKEVLVQAYSFTADPITFALVEAMKRGVHVEVLLDRSNEEDAHSDLRILVENQVPLLIDDKHAIAHNKIMLIDRRVIVTGSFNFTNQAEHQNAENLVIMTHHRELIQNYLANYQHHREHSHPSQRHALPGQGTDKRHKAA